jgi:hypothetical protein
VLEYVIELAVEGVVEDVAVGDADGVGVDDGFLSAEV